MAAEFLPLDSLTHDEREVVAVMAHFFTAEDTAPAVRIVSALHLVAGWWRQQWPEAPKEEFRRAFARIEALYGRSPKVNSDSPPDNQQGLRRCRRLAYLLLVVIENIRPPGTGPEPCGYAASMAWRILDNEFQLEGFQPDEPPAPANVQ